MMKKDTHMCVNSDIHGFMVPGTWYQVPGTSYQVDSLLGLTSEYPTV